MKVQRWVGLMAAALMLHTNAKVAFAACVLVDSDATTAERAQSHSASHVDPEADHSSSHHHEKGALPGEMRSSSGDRGGSGDAPAGDDSCEQMNSCGGYVILSQSSVRTGIGLSAAAVIPSNNEVLVGRAAAPEPPPPKA